jgi:hypothetical protein
MDFFIWEKYKKNEINEKIIYFVEVWEELISYFNKNSYGLDLISPHLNILDIIDEIESNHLENKENKKYFYRQINQILKNDSVINTIYESEFKLIRRVFNTNRSFYLLQLCKRFLEKFKKGDYFIESFKRLKKIILSKEWNENDEEKIFYFNQVLIIEFLLKGYSLDTIESLPRNLFDKYSVQKIKKNEIIFTNFPHGVKEEKFEKEDNFDRKSYNKEIKKIIDNLSIEQRLNGLIIYYKNKAKENYYIFPIEGLKGLYDFDFGIVNFYSPNIKKYIKNKDYSESEFFQRDKTKNYINAAVKVKDIDFISSRNSAIELIEKSFDLLKPYLYINKEIKLKVKSMNCIVVNKTGREVRSSFRREWNYQSEYSFYYDLNKHRLKSEKTLYSLFKSINKFLYKPKEEQNIIQSKLSYSLHWYRKAEETNNLEDKLLNYWIVVENILSRDIGEDILPDNIKVTSFSTIKEIFPYIEILNNVYQIGADLNNYLYHLYNNKVNDKRYLELPEEIAKKCMLTPTTESILIKDFINNLDLLERNIKKRNILEKISSTKKYYFDIDYAKRFILEQISSLSDDILLLYRLRNKIVHRAHFDNKILPYYVEKMERYSNILLREVIFSYSKNNELTLKEIIANRYTNAKIIINKIKDNIAIDFFDTKNY